MLSIVGIADVGSVHTHKWANYFAERGHDVHLIPYAPWPPAAARELAARVSVADWTLPSLHLKRFWITIRSVRRIRDLVRRRRAHLVHAHFLGAGAWYAGLAGRHPLVVSVMGGGDVRGTRWEPQSPVDRLLTPYTLKRSDLVTCWSRNLARAVRPLVPPRTAVEVVLGGVDLGVFRRHPDVRDVRRRLNLAAADFVIFAPRLFWPLQNIETIVRAMPLVISAEPRARLVLVKYRAAAFPEHEARIERLIDELGIRPAVRLAAPIAYSEMPAHYSAADCTVSVPSTDGTPMTVMESLAIGTPAVIGDLPDYDPEIFADGETVVRVRVADAAALANGVLRLRRDERLRETLRQNGRRIVSERADYRTEMSRLESLYAHLLSPLS